MEIVHYQFMSLFLRWILPKEAVHFKFYKWQNGIVEETLYTQFIFNIFNISLATPNYFVLMVHFLCYFLLLTRIYNNFRCNADF